MNLASATTPENSGTPLVYSFQRVGPTDAPLTVHFSLMGTAVKDADYGMTGQSTFDAMTSTGTITIPVGASSADLTITPTGDVLIEPDESVIIKIESN